MVLGIKLSRTANLFTEEKALDLNEAELMGKSL